MTSNVPVKSTIRKKISEIYQYIRFQLNLLVISLHDWKDRQKADYKPVPPAKLRYRVHGDLDKTSYLQVGKRVAQNIHDICKATENNLYSFERILDFGCGCGRVIQNFQAASKSNQLYASDIDAELVNWGKKNLPKIQWHVNTHYPPSPFGDNAFDLIYAISVFTHLDEEFQHAWLRELRRISKPRGIVLLSVHGSYAASKVDPKLQKDIQKKGFVFITQTTGKFKLDGLPDFYQTTYHTKKYIYDKWSAYFDIVNYIERGINNHQDLVILKRS